LTRGREAFSVMGTRLFLYSLEEVEAEDCFKIPVTLYQLIWRYLQDI